MGLEQASSLYNHLKSKEEVLQHICFTHARRFVEGIDCIEQEDISATEKVKRLIGLHIQIAIEDRTSITVFNDEWRYLSEPFLSEFLELRRYYENHFKAIITEGIDRGEFKAVDSHTALFTLLTSVRWIHYWYKPERDITVEQLEADILQLLMGGLER